MNVMPVQDVVSALAQLPHGALRHVAAEAGLARCTLHRAIASGGASLGEQAQLALTPVLRRVAAGKLSWRRVGRRWEQVCSG